ncbi:mitotic checkpoint regulator, MAD2B-interacting-domain-containing protein [Hypoxylon trugodes]|uniref:mitotic checkpoint regulator, MAD2B-interacting-domain-containing protein n=1 Tax=Hypoxylon trugodes TaxID=326681 RepID=UPI00218F5C8D|nr:mitotic checkpoint regulator, MAD2B-interacting-domain-containing protein [Hypoxylon trugodes]KAI1393731.1 mitotic checkpoint regulator, MAD2B-interacting-domain-containing protein [Hypoxylon trugodes]
MGLVDYSDSESDSEPVTKLAPASTASGKRPFQKVVDRAKPGKILVNLPQTSSESIPENAADEPPPKRTRIAGKGGGAFGGFNSFLPPPKNVGKPTVASSSGKPAPRPGVNLKTGAAPGFSRETNGDDEGTTDQTTKGDDAEAPGKQPSIPADQKPAEEVKLVGKPLMFKPLSVSRKPGKKTIVKPKAVPAPVIPTLKPSKNPQAQEAPAGPPAKKQKISLFSLPDKTTSDDTETITPSGAYEPMFTNEDDTTNADEFAAYDAQFSTNLSSAPPAITPNTEPETLDSIASSMNLSAAARRELFGRGGDPSLLSQSSKVINFDTDREYAHNEALRASGQLQPAYNPLRSVATGGKSSLRQLVSRVQNQKDALEESFAKARGNRNDAGSRYGWR